MNTNTQSLKKSAWLTSKRPCPVITTAVVVAPKKAGLTLLFMKLISNF
ncbi:hypothetical protein [Peredibacter starrii]|uniref:Uncharacterized protein n=1 Tax=Peredibacter starrii TaxID=28202 RepID=A0AAX4HTN5_9BACT|nr:hypothetical protein [Peredibacter starrii]WPU66596.1 hypothetical protein SOO65_07545 [Peredibacter starrii]